MQVFLMEATKDLSSECAYTMSTFIILKYPNPAYKCDKFENYSQWSVIFYYLLFSCWPTSIVFKADIGIKV